MNDGHFPADRWCIPYAYGHTPLTVSTLTLSSKIHKHAHAFLEQAAREVNQVWNFCNATSYKSWNNYCGSRKWMSAFDMNNLLAGCGDEFKKIGIDTAQCVSAEHANKRNQFKKSKLAFRKSGGVRKSHGWIPFKANTLRFSVSNKSAVPSEVPSPQVELTSGDIPSGKVSIVDVSEKNRSSKKAKQQQQQQQPKKPTVLPWPKKNDGESDDAYALRKKEFAPLREKSQAALKAWEYQKLACGDMKVSFMGKTMKLYNGERVFDAVRLAKQGVGAVRAGNFAQDAVGDWYLNVVIDRVEAQLAPLLGQESAVGLDPGQINTFTASDGSALPSRYYRLEEENIKKAQQNAHKKQAKRLHRKVRRRRQDARNKYCRNIVNTYQHIYVGDLSPKKMAKSNLKGQAKSIYDAGIGLAYSTLEAMGHRAGRVVKKVSERNSSRICSNCQALAGPTGLDGCGVRLWSCSACGTAHDRDANSGKIICQVGQWERNSPQAGSSPSHVVPRYRESVSRKR